MIKLNKLKFNKIQALKSVKIIYLCLWDISNLQVSLTMRNCLKQEKSLNRGNQDMTVILKRDVQKKDD